MTAAHFRQARTIASLELRRVFFSRRSFWVYFLALFPSVIFIGHGIESKVRQQNWSNRITPAETLASIHEGQRDTEVLQIAPGPIQDNEWHRHRRGEDNEPTRRYMMYFDGKRRVHLNFSDGILTEKRTSALLNFEDDREVFAGVFQFFYLRLAIFFGCLGIFMNLFRGEMLDKTLHYWLLAPARREVLLAGKYLAGLAAAAVIFAGGTVLCFLAMLWPQDPAELTAYWNSVGPMHMFRYASVAMLGCVGYGSAFLAAGLLLRNPIIPAVVLLLWEGINGFLPTILQKFSIIYYLQSLSPVPPPMDPEMPSLVRLLLAPAEPASAPVAVFGLFAVTGLVLWTASRAVRRLEINYSTD